MEELNCGRLSFNLFEEWDGISVKFNFNIDFEGLRTLEVQRINFIGIVYGGDRPYVKAVIIGSDSKTSWYVILISRGFVSVDVSGVGIQVS